MVTFNHSYDYAESGNDNGLFFHIAELTRLATGLGQVPWLYRLLQFVPWPFNGLKVQFDVAQKRVCAITGAAADERKERFESGDKFDKDIVGRLLNNPPEDGMSDLETKSAIIGTVVAGVGDVAVFMSAVIYFLLKNPEKLKALRTELDQRSANGTLSKTARTREAEHCPYLQAVFNETLRLHPPPPGLLQRLVPKGGMEIAGYYVPEGVRSSL